MTTIRHCIICGISLTGRHFNTKICSDHCRNVWATIYGQNRERTNEQRASARERALRYRLENLELIRSKDRKRGKTLQRRAMIRASYRKRHPVQTRLCSVCGTQFAARTNAITCSKNCGTERAREYRKKWHSDNKERTQLRKRETARLWREKNRERVRELNRKFARRQHVILAAVRELGLIHIEDGDYAHDAD